MEKFKKSIECIECGEKLLKQLYPSFIKYKSNFDNLSDFEKSSYNSIIGSQFALVCEYYLKGLLIPNIKVNIPLELSNKISILTEEQELMIIVADEEKIKNDPVLQNLDKKELKLLLNGNSLKRFGHSLVSLLGTKSLTDNIIINLPVIVRESIILKLKSYLGYSNSSNLYSVEDRVKMMDILNQNISGNKGINRISYGDNLIEQAISSSSVSNAFPKGRYGVFDEFNCDIDWLSGLALSIRHGIKYQYPNMIEVLKNNSDLFGKLIYPDKSSVITVEYMNGKKVQYDMFENYNQYAYGELITLDAARVIEIEENKEILEKMKKYVENFRFSDKKIYLEEKNSGSTTTVQYFSNGQLKILELKEDEIIEIHKEGSVKLDNNDNPVISR